jgi:hypothetical protein
MKFTTKILATVFLLMIAGLVFSNVILRREFDKVDKTDIYWNYERVLEKPFKYLKITGGNITNIAFEQSPHPSVRLLQDWKRYHGGHIKAQVQNDTLYIDFDFSPPNPFEKMWLRGGVTPLRIFSPELLSFTGFNTNFEMFKARQTSINVNLSGRSRFELESMIPDLDSLTVKQSDSSEVVFEMSPNYRTTTFSDPAREGSRITTTDQIKSDEAMRINSVKASLEGYSILDIGHSQVKSMQLRIADSSAIILSGGALRKIDKTTLIQ